MENIVYTRVQGIKYRPAAVQTLKDHGVVEVTSLSPQGKTWRKVRVCPNASFTGYLLIDGSDVVAERKTPHGALNLADEYVSGKKVK